MADPLDADALGAEVAAGNFDDARLTKRLGTIVRRLSSEPSASLPRLLNSAELEGAYRFFSNPRVGPDEILSSHIAAVRGRCAERKRVLVVHDTTDFSYRVDGARQNLGRARSSNQTFYGHFSLALTADGSRKPLGIAAMRTWTRGPEPDGTEHARWFAQARVAAANLDGETHAIHVMDREGDDYALFAKLSTHGEHFVIRGYINRRAQLSPDTPVEKLTTVLATIEIEVGRTAKLTMRRPKRSPTKAKTHPARTARVAKLSVGAMSICLPRPRVRSETDLAALPSELELNIVRVWEANPPEGEPPVEWFLFTNEPISTAAEVLDVVDHYRARWTIEEYFKALKTGCSFERRQLQDYESLVNLLATFAPIAYQALLLRSQARTEPDAPATTVLSTDEIDVLRELGRLPLPPSPSVRQAMLAVAALGGHIKYSGDPGWQTLSRGYEKLESLTAGWVAARKFRPRSDQR